MDRYDPYTDKFINDVHDINVGDTISRLAAIHALKELTANGTNKGMIFGEDAVHRIEMLPSAQPEIVRCKDCNHFYKDNLNQWCFLGKYGVKENGFCSRAERRTNE